MDRIDICPISLVEALKWGRANDPTVHAKNVMMGVVLINRQNQPSLRIIGLKPGLHSEHRGIVSLQVGHVKLPCAGKQHKSRKPCVLIFISSFLHRTFKNVKFCLGECDSLV